jgi:hypothetical protein
MITMETDANIGDDGFQDARDAMVLNRAARDRLVLILGIGVPYPLRDLRLEYPEIVAVDQDTKIKIMGGQTGVVYRLCDSEGNELIPSYEVKPDGSEGEGGVMLATPKITKDITFSIMAVREDADLGVILETYLNELVAIEVGLNQRLALTFRPQGNQIARNGQLVVDYGEKSITIAVADSQEGVTYQVFEDTGDNENGKSLSDPVLGKGTMILLTLKSGATLVEDTAIKVKASRKHADQDSWVFLDTRLSISVRPDPTVGVSVDFPIVDYKGTPKFTLTRFQATATYELYQRGIIPSEYAGDAIRVQSRELSGFVKVAAFVGGTVTSGNLTEDSLFNVTATKINNGETLQLNQFIAVFVRPSPDPEVRAERSPILAGTSGMVLVNNPQKGVEYQLLNVDNTSVGSPGFHYTDRGVGTTRVGVDFGVDTAGEKSVLLPTAALDKQTTFKVRATSIYAHQSTELRETVSIDVTAPTPGNSPGES